jgi:hypothetical protein
VVISNQRGVFRSDAKSHSTVEKWGFKSIIPTDRKVVVVGVASITTRGNQNEITGGIQAVDFSPRRRLPQT